MIKMNQFLMGLGLVIACGALVPAAHGMQQAAQSGLQALQTGFRAAQKVAEIAGNAVVDAAGDVVKRADEALNCVRTRHLARDANHLMFGITVPVGGTYYDETNNTYVVGAENRPQYPYDPLLSDSTKAVAAGFGAAVPYVVLGYMMEKFIDCLPISKRMGLALTLSGLALPGCMTLGLAHKAVEHFPEKKGHVLIGMCGAIIGSCLGNTIEYALRKKS